MARITIIKPAGFTGSIGRTRFDKGEGETGHPSAVAYFRRNPERFEVREDEAEPDPEDDGNPLAWTDGNDEADPYDLSVEALRKLASHRGIAVRGSKAELQERLREQDAADAVGHGAETAEPDQED